MAAADTVMRRVSGFAAFLRAETTGGLLLLAATVAALVWANAALGIHHTVVHLAVPAGVTEKHVAE
ncbi:Na+/H+ antiporter NhaA [Frankia alni]|nr:Na+/H+ antiporter NhaA [Frankia alni]